MGCTTSSDAYQPEVAEPPWSDASKDTPLFTFVGKTVTAKVVDLYDGDTVDAVLWVDQKMQRFKVRMYGYDAPESKPLKTVEHRERVIEQA